MMDSIEEGENNALMNETIAEVISKKQMSWRRAVALSIVAGCTAPVMVACLAYVDSMKRDKLPQNLVIVDVLEGVSCVGSARFLCFCYF